MSHGPGGSATQQVTPDDTILIWVVNEPVIIIRGKRTA